MMTTAKPLILITRPQAQAEQFGVAIRDVVGDRADVVIAPVLRVDARDADVEPTHDVIFSSVNGVRYLAQRGEGRRAFCVGPRTAQAAREVGFDVVEASGNSESLISRIQSFGDLGPLVHARGAHSIGDIATRLTTAGATVTDAVVYTQTEIKLTKGVKEQIRRAKLAILPIFSPRTARILSRQLVGVQAEMRTIALSPEIARHVGFAKEIDVAPSKSAQSMIKCLQRHIVA
jgi:uroporphyrinogen-III synthase